MGKSDSRMTFEQAKAFSTEWEKARKKLLKLRKKKLDFCSVCKYNKNKEGKR